MAQSLGTAPAHLTSSTSVPGTALRERRVGSRVADRSPETAGSAGEGGAYVVSADGAVRQGILAMLAGAGIAAEGFSSDAAFLAALKDIRPGCILVTAASAGDDPTAFQQELRVRGCPYPVIAITPESDVSAAVRAMKAGAGDVVTQPLRCEDVRVAVRSALAQLSRSQAVESSIVQMRARVESLTRREAQVLDAMLRGGANKAIAHELGISPRTVEVHRAKVMGKLGCRSIPELVHVAMRLGIARP